jgi:hypothetical protein
MVKAIVGLINVMGMLFNCNVTQGYNGAKHVNPNDIVIYKDLGNHMMLSYLILKIYIFKSYNEISNIKIVCYRTQTLKLICIVPKYVSRIFHCSTPNCSLPSIPTSHTFC